MFFFFFNDTATTEIYTLSLHDALPISRVRAPRPESLSADVTARLEAIERGLQGLQQELAETQERLDFAERLLSKAREERDRKSTRLNSSHSQISYAVFCLKKKKRKS